MHSSRHRGGEMMVPMLYQHVGRLSEEILERQELLVVDAALSDSMIYRTFLDFRFLDY